MVPRGWPGAGLAHGKSCHTYTHRASSWGMGAGSGLTRPPRPGLATLPIVPLHTCLGLALEVESQYVFPRPSLTLADHEEAMAPGPACQHQLSCLDPGQCPVEPGVVRELQLRGHLGLWLCSLFPCRGSQREGVVGGKYMREEMQHLVEFLPVKRCLDNFRTRPGADPIH